MDSAALLSARKLALQSRGESRATGAALFAKLMELDARLVARGFPPMTPWWKEQLEAFYRSGRRLFVARVGRKGTKSATMCRVAVAEMLYGQHLLRPGDIGLFMFISENVPEAKGRVFTIKKILDALDVRYKPLERDTLLEGTSITFGVRAGRIGAVSGPVVIGLVADEVSKWKDEETGANPASEVLSSVRPAMVTQSNAHEFMISSPWSTIDAHAEAFARGDTEEQMAVMAPTWVANPTVTEADTVRLEPDEQTRMREYGAVPMGSGEAGFFDHGAIDRAVRGGAFPLAQPAPGSVVTAGGDLAFQRDCATLCIAHRLGEWESTATRYRVADMIELRPTADKPLMPGEVVAQFAAKLKEHHVPHMMADGHYRMSAIEHLQEHGLQFADAPEGQTGKADTYVRARVLLHSGLLELPNDTKLVRQLKEVLSAPTPGGGTRIWSPRKSGGSHGDMVSALVLALWQKFGYQVPGHPGPAPGSREWAELQRKKDREKDIAATLGGNDAPWFAR